ncbi:hypothetical protein K0A97_01840 [Patescibacteria group bacterium]|nr:hypothetical protein [Patescibacteria group bacterium]
MNKKLLFFCPFYYDFFVRENKSPLKKVAGYFLIFSFIPFYLFFFRKDTLLDTLLIYFFSIITCNFVYELGHIYNDFFSIKIEKNPTIKHKKTLKKRDYYLILFFRFGLISLFLYLTRFYYLGFPLLFLLFILYSAHNNLKEKFRPITFVLLRLWKVFWVLSFFRFNLIEIITILFIFWGYNYLEIWGYSIRKTKSKKKDFLNNLKIFKNKKIYYSLTLLLVFFLNLFLLIFNLNTNGLFYSFYITYTLPRLKEFFKRPNLLINLKTLQMHS